MGTVIDGAVSTVFDGLRGRPRRPPRLPRRPGPAGRAPADLFSPAAPSPVLDVEERLWLDLLRALSPAEHDALPTVGRSMIGGNQAQAIATKFN